MIGRRRFIGGAAAVAGTALVGARGARAQPAPRSCRIGILRPTAEPKTPDEYTSEVLLPAALAKLGYVRGRNLAIETRYAGGDVLRLAKLARELVALKVDVIVAVGSAAVTAAREATTAIPIVMWGNFDPVEAGFVSNLARPGGNVTGVLISAEGTLAAKKLELLKEAVPQARKIAVLAPDEPNAQRIQLPELKEAAAALRVELAVAAVRKDKYADAFKSFTAARADALFVLATTYFVIGRKPIIELATRHRLPSMWEWREQVAAGGLMAYGTSLAARNQRIADYIDRIVRGAHPGDLPVDRPVKFELCVNAATARAIGLTLPPAFLLRVDDLIA